MDKVTLQAALEATGFLSRDQLWQHFQLTPEELVLQDQMLWHRTGLWHRTHFRGGQQARHWALRSAVYLALFPQLSDWHLEPRDDDVIHPDASMHLSSWVDVTISLECDTGVEKEREWMEKLERYQSAQTSWHLLVVATGTRLRLSRLRSWLLEYSPIPWILTTPENLVEALSQGWHPPMTMAEPSSKDVTSSHTVQREPLYQLEDQRLDVNEAESGLKSGALRVDHLERRHLVDYIILKRSK